jgi:glycosyltransferase involved in cell wall biosynthesis
MFVRNWPEPMLALGRAFYDLARPAEFVQSRQLDQQQMYNLRRSAQWLYRGLETEPLRDALLFTNPMERFASFELLGAVNAALGDVERTIDICEKGLEALPESEVLRQNLTWAKRQKALNDGGFTGEAKVLPIPAELAASPVEPQKPAQGKLDLVFFLGPAYEAWTPETWAANGMGGSETMAWELARRLRARGHRVRMYTHCTPEQEGLYEGVEWLQWQRFRSVKCDVLIASRAPWAVRDVANVDGGDGSVATVGGCKYTASILWVHDVRCWEFNQLEQRRIDRVLCLSKWHAEYFAAAHHVDPAKVHVTRNGIDLKRFDGTEERIPHRAIYSSSPDRGLLAAVLAWPKIRANVPDAELHCFYGFANWEKSAADNPAEQRVIAQLKHLCATTPGIVMRGRVSQKELAREFMRAGVWCYPTWFSETSCITAMEAQAAGCRVVTCPVAALAETVGDRRLLLQEKWDYPNPPSEAFVAEVFRMTVGALRHTAYPDESNMRYAREHFGLDSLADEWSEMMLELEAERALNPIPHFRGDAE